MCADGLMGAAQELWIMAADENRGELTLVANGSEVALKWVSSSLITVLPRVDVPLRRLVEGHLAERPGSNSECWSSSRAWRPTSLVLGKNNCCLSFRVARVKLIRGRVMRVGRRQLRDWSDRAPLPRQEKGNLHA